MPEYKCPKCGCEKVYAKPQGRRMGVYCADCNTWIRFTTYKKMKDIYNNLDEENLNDEVSVRRIKKLGNVTRMYCSKCQCLLYNSNYSKIEGQFDLVNANFCPRCGRKLI